MSSFEAVIDRMKQEGDLTRNSGTNSLKQINRTLESILETLSKNFKTLQNIKTATPSRTTPRDDTPRPERISPEFKTQRSGGVISAMSSAISGQTIGRLGIGSSGKAQQKRKEIADASGLTKLREMREGAIEKLYSFSDSKTKNKKEDESLKEEKEQTSLLRELVGTFKKRFFKEKQENLKRADVESQQREFDFGGEPTAEPKEKSKGIFGTLFSLLGSGLSTIFGPIIALLTNPTVLALLVGIGAFLVAVKTYEKDILAARDALVEWSKPFTDWLQKTGGKLRNTLGIAIDTVTGLTKSQEKMMQESPGTESDFQSNAWKGKSPYMTKEEREQYNKQLETGQAKITSKRTEEIKQGLSRSEVESALKTEEGKRSGFWNSIVGPGDRIVSGPLAGLTMDQARALLESTELKDTAPKKQMRNSAAVVMRGPPPAAYKEGAADPDDISGRVVPRGIPESSQQLGQGSGQRPIIVNNVSAPTTVDASTNAPTTVNGGGNGYSAPAARRQMTLYPSMDATGA